MGDLRGKAAHRLRPDPSGALRAQIPLYPPSSKGEKSTVGSFFHQTRNQPFEKGGDRPKADGGFARRSRVSSAP
jgi:hypothetical protein